MGSRRCGLRGSGWRRAGADRPVGVAHRGAEAAHGRGVLDALGGLDARADVNGPGPDAAHPCGHICGMQPTRQNDRKGQRRRERATNRRPFRRRRSPRRGRRAAAPGRAGSGSRSLASRRPAPCARRAGTAGPWRAHSAGDSSPWNCSSSVGMARSAASTASGAALTNSPHRRDEGRQPARQRGGTVDVDAARAALVEDEPDRVGAGGDRGVDVGLAGDAADLDARALLHRPSVTARAAPSAEPVGRGDGVGDGVARVVVRARGSTARRRRRSARRARGRREASTSASQPALRWPLATKTSEPTRLRTMWCRNALASKSSRQ